MFVIKYRKIFYAFSILLVVLSIASIAKWGLKGGIDFKGGSIIEIEYVDARPDMGEVYFELSPLEINASVRPTGEKGYIIRTKTLTEEEHAKLLTAISDGGKAKLEVKRFDTIGPILGAELRAKSLVSIILVIIAIVLFNLCVPKSI